MKTLFKKQRACPGQDRVWRWIVDYKVLNDGNSPTYEQIALALGLAKTTVYIHVKRLAERGKLIHDDSLGVIKLVGGKYVPPGLN
jgi:hypothetical protein